MTLEKDIEAAVGRKIYQWSRANNIPVHFLKLTVLGNRGYPDRIILSPGRVMFVEFKRHGEKPRKLQEHVHASLRGMGFDVLVHDNVEKAVEEITCLLGKK